MNIDTERANRYMNEVKILADIDIAKEGSIKLEFRAIASKLAEKCVKCYWVTHMRPEKNMYWVTWGHQ